MDSGHKAAWALFHSAVGLTFRAFIAPLTFDSEFQLLPRMDSSADQALFTAFLQKISPMPLEKATEIALQFEPLSLQKGEFLIQEKGAQSRYFFMANGFMRAFALNTDGIEVTTNFFAAPCIVFEVSSFFMQTHSIENILALSDCSGFVISFQDLNRLFHGLPEFREFGRSILVKGFVALKTRMLALIHETAEERYANMLSTNPKIFQHAALKDIASYLGITDTSLSRIRKHFADKS
jgi:CRP-like cAMP-binding protein